MKEASAFVPVSSANGLARLPLGARVLIIRLRSMGDTVLLTPSLRLLHEWRPDLSVSVLAEHPWDELLEGNPCVQAVISMEGKLKTAYRIRRAHFDAVMNFHGGPTSAWLTRLSGAGLRAGFAHFRSQAAYNAHIPTAQEVLCRNGPVHTAEHIASSFFWLGVPFATIPPAEVFPSEQAAARVAERLRSLGITPGEQYAVLHPAALYETKQWRPSGFAEISEYLEDRYGLRSIYTGGAQDSRTLNAVEKFASRNLLRACGWSIRELVALIAGARIFIGNDSGPAHIAAAAKVPAVVIFGSSHSDLWRPWQAPQSAVVQNYFDCNPCPGDRCYAFAEPRCILSITLEQVKVCVDALLADRPRVLGRSERPE